MLYPSKSRAESKSRRGGTCLAVLLLSLDLISARALGAFVTNLPSADTSLMEIEPSHSNGGQDFFISGHIQNPFRARGLLRFDFNSLPINTLIQSIVLELTVVRQPSDGLANSAFGLHRMLRAWGEGSKVAFDRPGQGVPASAGDATWTHSFYPTNAWTEPGGAVHLDYVSSASSFQDIQGTGETYRFPSTPELVEDVQRWVNDPASNFGWIFISNAEDTPFTARLFGSRENLDAHPKLEVEYFVPPRIESSARTNHQFVLTFTAWQGQSYSVEFREHLTTGQWQTLTNLGQTPATTQHTITDSIVEPRRFYRLATH